jgi:hypothetical protein
MNLKSIHKTNFLNYYNTYSSSFLFFGLLLCIGIANAQVKIGDNPTEISHYSILELQSSNKGLLLPRMNTQERDQAFNQETPEGMVIYNTDLQMLQFFFYPIDSDTGERLLDKVWNTAGEEVFSGNVPNAPFPGDLFYNKDNNILYAWDDEEQLWIPLNLGSSGGSGVGVDDPTAVSSNTYQSFGFQEVITESSNPTNAMLSNTKPGILFANTTNGNLYVATDTDQDGTPDLWDRVAGGGGGGGGGGTVFQTLDLSGNTLSISDGNSITLPISPASPPQTLSISRNNLSISGGNTVSLTIVSGQASNLIMAGSDGGAFLDDSLLGLFSGIGSPTLTSVTSPTAGNIYVDESTGDVYTYTTSNMWEIQQGDNIYTADGTFIGSRVASFNATDTLTFEGTVSNTVIYNTHIELKRGLQDSNGDFGTSGQVLSTTGSDTTQWISAAQGLIRLESGNYTAQVEDGTILVQPTGAVIITLPTPTTAQNGTSLTVKRANTYTGSNTLAITSTASFDQSNDDLNLNVSYQGYTLKAYEGSWYITQRF